MGTSSNLNNKIALKITAGVSTMWCAYIFAAIALISLPNAIKSGDTIVIVSWIAQTFLQLVLLSIIMVGQNVQSKGFEKTINETHAATLLELAELKVLSQEMHQVIRDLETRIPPEK